jgi:hypothetical protein
MELATSKPACVSVPQETMGPPVSSESVLARLGIGIMVIGMIDTAIGCLITARSILTMNM